MTDLLSGRSAPATALVVAKAPVPGRVKTRLAARVGDRLAAELAHAALLDTLEGCEQVFPPDRLVVALAGRAEESVDPIALCQALSGWVVVPQRGVGLAARLVEAHRDAHALCDGPVVQVGMDTPHVEPEVLANVALVARGGLPVLGRAHDGGWWVLATARPADVEGLDSVPMSTSHTYAATLASLRRAAGGVVAAPELGDIDTADDARLAARTAPATRFARAWTAWAS
jgi:glycosyltransferase A (GT-A) superfamily protein (DUF2064 family)